MFEKILQHSQSELSYYKGFFGLLKMCYYVDG